MKDRIGHKGQDLFMPSMALSLVLSLLCLASGCGAKPGADTASSEMPESAKNLRDHMKQQAAAQKGAMGKGQRPVRRGN
jgi:hypothetical protein